MTSTTTAAWMCSAAVASALGFGCATSSEAYQREVDRVLAAPVGRSREIPAPAELVSPPWKVGQWALYKTRQRGEIGYRRISVVARGACGFWMESVEQTAKRRLAVKVCLRALDSSASLDADRIELIVAQVDEEKIEAFDFRSGKNARARRSFQAAITMVAHARWGEPKAVREDISVPAGHFVQAWRGSETYTLGGQTIDISLWAHPAVPIAGTVRVTISNGDEVVLIDFGQDGARTTLPNVPGA